MLMMLVSGAGAGKPSGKQPAKRQKGGTAARDAIKAAAKQRRKVLFTNAMSKRVKG